MGIGPQSSRVHFLHPFYPSSPEGALRMGVGANPVGCTLGAPVLSIQPGGCTPDGGTGHNPVGCTLGAPVLSIQPGGCTSDGRWSQSSRVHSWCTRFIHPARRVHFGWALEPIQSGALLVHPHLIDRRSHIGWASLTSRACFLRSHLKTKIWLSDNFDTICLLREI
jgi:hypothetical protein